MRQSHIYKVKQPVDQDYDTNYINDIITQSFKKIAPCWPLKNFIAVNPLQGMEDLTIEEAMTIASVYFEQRNLPKQLETINRETIKWLQAYFDDGQATISMPLRNYGLYTSWRQLALYDIKLHQCDKQKQDFLRLLPKTAEQAVTECLILLNIAKEEQVQFLTLILTTLPGWASYIKYLTEWAGTNTHPYSVNQVDYLAIRLIIITLFWKDAQELLEWYKNSLTQVQSKPSPLEKIQITENNYRYSLLRNLAKQHIKSPDTIPDVQLIFCIDVRSEPFRKHLESIGNYYTFGVAGFFGIPIQIHNKITNESYASCPILLSPKHQVEVSSNSYQNDKAAYATLTILKRLYQSLKYNFTTPFGLVDNIGVISGMWMGIRSLIPSIASKIQSIAIKSIYDSREFNVSLDNISFSDQCSYALNILKIIGLTSNFAPIIVFCGHASTTQNNAYSTALDCGACGGRHGGTNARIIAAILNRSEVRQEISKNGINIPENTYFIAAEHNTTTDEVSLYGKNNIAGIDKLKADLIHARNANNKVRLQTLEKKVKKSNAVYNIGRRSHDWAQIRPEWGLARNSAFIIAPRDITSGLDLAGRCFLHSYDYTQDLDGSSLTTILTAPMIVAHWINMQYLFSTLNNIAYGSGSKITKNITGRIGIMQGNASDLMTGLPLQSLYSSDTEAYHEPQRLIVVIFAPRQMLDQIISAQPILQQLFGNGWAQMSVIQPEDRKIYLLNRDFTWKQID
ncbi:MAG: DUF2309 domain-containing protein [Rickettsiaceae bacterium]|nr:DUF2309 domain-containing protein [Rickettsiaceae bacterium]